MYNINPFDTIDYNGVKVPRVLCHYDSYKLGLGNSHYDIYGWFPKFGKNMETVRQDVAELLNEKEEDDDMVYYKTLNDVPSYYKNAVQKAVDKGAIKGTGNDELNLSEDLCRTLTILDRLGKLD